MVNNNFFPIYIFYGTNNHAKQKKVQAIKKIVLKDDVNDFNYNVLYSDDQEIQRIVDLANTFPFCSEYRLIIVKNFEKYSTKDKKNLEEYVKNPAPHTCLILEDGDKPDKRESLYKILEENNKTTSIETFWSYRYKELVQVIIETFKSTGKNIDYDASEVLAELIETNPETLDEEIKKITSFVADKKNISLSDIKENVIKSQNHDIYEWAIKITKQEYVSAIKFLNNFSPKELQAPQLLLFVLTDRFIKISKYLTLLNEGMDTKMAQKSLGIMSFLDPDFHRQAIKFSLENNKLADIFDLLINTDFNIKTGIGNSKLLLEDLIFNISKIMK
jgi:DNA polymerase-3 subunit delta